MKLCENLKFDKIAWSDFEWPQATRRAKRRKRGVILPCAPLKIAESVT